MSGICGFAGINDDALLTRMTDCISHRGPDESGYYQAGDVSFGHRRLNVIDIQGGKQPMSNEDGSVTIVFNGKIYNYRELRHQLESRGYTFRTASDTEVLLCMFEEEGPQALQRLNGMFAFAIHDRRRNEVFLARDRIGIKPLYYLNLPNAFLFASEMKALLAYPDWIRTTNPRAIQDYLALSYVPGDGSMFAEVKRLPAGHYLVYRDGSARAHCYWEPPVFSGPYSKNEDAYYEEFAELMELSVSRRMISDVPFGAYLDGDLDSSVIAALMTRFASESIKTFSVGFDRFRNELSDAAKSARLLGCDHTEILYSAADAGRLPDIVYHMDEPQGDPISIPMFVLSGETKEKVAVVLTGEGGNEVFGGHVFHRMMWMGEVYRRAVPEPVRNQLVTPLFSKIPAPILNAAFQYPANSGGQWKLKALDYLQMLEPDQIDQAYRHFISINNSQENENLFTTEYSEQLRSTGESNGSVNPPVDIPYINRLLLLQFGHWLPDNMLLRGDRMGMAHGIESRVPYLDHELVEFAMRLPPQLKLHHLSGKYILRSYASKLLPAAVTKRKKTAVYEPVEKFFEQATFQEMMNDLLSDISIRNRGIFRVDTIAQIRKKAQQSQSGFVKQAFSLMVLEMWFRIFVDRRRVG